MEEQIESLKQELLAGLPPAGSLTEKTKNYALDRIQEAKRQGNKAEEAHYKEVLRKLTCRSQSN